MVIDIVDHVTAVVADVNAAGDAIERLLGARASRAIALPAMDIRSFRIGATELHLNAPSGPGPVREHLDEHGPSIHHLALRVSHLETALAELSRRGLPARGRIVTTAPGLREVFLDPGATAGLWIQLVERGKQSRGDRFDAEAVHALAAVTASSKIQKALL